MKKIFWLFWTQIVLCAAVWAVVCAAVWAAGNSDVAGAAGAQKAARATEKSPIVREKPVADSEYKESLRVPANGAPVSNSQRAGLKPQRVVSLMPSNTEIVYELGLQDRLLAVTNYCDYPASARSKDKIGDFVHPNFEKILSLNPDLVLAGKWKSSTIAARLSKAGVSIEEVPLPATIEEIYATIEQIAQTLGQKERGARAVSRLKIQEKQLAERGRKRKKTPTFYIEVDPPNWTISKKSYINDALERCGARNIFRDLSLSGAQISWEIIFEQDPDVLIILGASKEEIARRPGWKNLSAVKKGHVLDKTGGLILNRPTGRIFEDMEKFSNKLDAFGY